MSFSRGNAAGLLLFSFRVQVRLDLPLQVGFPSFAPSPGHTVPLVDILPSALGRLGVRVRGYFKGSSPTPVTHVDLNPAGTTKLGASVGKRKAYSPCWS